MSKSIKLFSLLVVLFSLVACSEESPDVEWELAVDGDVNQPVAYSYADLVKLRRARLTDVPTRDPNNPGQKESWEGITLFLLLQEPGGVEYSVDSWALVTLADGSTRRFSMADLRGALIALKDGDGNWLVDLGKSPLRLIPPNLPSSDWLEGPVRISIHQE